MALDEEATDGALIVATLMQNKLTEFNQERDRLNLPPIRCGIGIHRGEVLMGTVGYTSRIDIYGYRRCYECSRTS